MKRFVTILNGWKPLTVITNRSILDVAAVLDLPLWIFTSGIFRLALEITFYLTSIFSCKWFSSYSHKVENLISRGVLIRAGGLENFLKQNKRGRGGGGEGGALIRGPRVGLDMDTNVVNIGVSVR